ncbi:MAG: hypothetical protein GX628_10185 [Clostridiales bacterium]|nr:hypothetical protein [Clostridiales bacterium]
MKAKDFRPEHFEKGRSFDKDIFEAYKEASDNLEKTSFKIFLPCVAAGLLLGLLFSEVIGGIAGNTLNLISILAGLFVGGYFNKNASRKVDELAARLGITDDDVAAAGEHLKNGTFAWVGGDRPAEGQTMPRPEYNTQTGGNPVYRPDNPMQTNAGDIKPVYRPDNPMQPDAKPVYAYENHPHAKRARTLPETPMRAVRAALFLALGWLLLTVFQLIFAVKLLYSPAAHYCLAAAMLGAAAYLISKNGLRWKLTGGGIGLVSALLLAFSYVIGLWIKKYLMTARFEMFMPFSDTAFLSYAGRVFTAVLLSLAAALVFSVLLRERGKLKNTICGAAAGAVYMLVMLIPMLRVMSGMSPNHLTFRRFITEEIFPVIVSAAAIFFVGMAVYSLCNLPNLSVKLRGAGLVWAWLALVGSFVTISLVTCVGLFFEPMPAYQLGLYAYNIILGGSAFVGYILLLCGRRTGLYFILIGIGLTLGAQLFSALSLLIEGRAGSGVIVSLLIPTLLGALNPLFAWLAVGAGTKPD